ncbi:MAG: Holliday junction branch migration protein RuvA [Sutterellaceae bacterium]|nr:Holliday junction branch migration protein RuvA [Sutterellaceae bacterium]
MIGRIEGRLIEKNPPQVLVDVHGVGYEIDVPMSTFYNLPAVGQTVVLLTHFVVREDAQLLYGFASAKERSVFRILIKISGIGARTALAILSGMSVEALAQAVSMQDTAMLTRVPGIGKKTAERLVLELKGKLGADLTGPALGTSPNDARSDVAAALVALGYSEKEALAAAKRLPEDISVNDGIREALKSVK